MDATPVSKLHAYVANHQNDRTARRLLNKRHPFQFRDKTMKRLLFVSVWAAALLAAPLSGCTLGGAAAGGYVGHEATHGSTVGTVGGAVAGGIIGHELGK